LLTTCILFSNPVSEYTWDAFLLPIKAVPLRMSWYFICPLWFISMSSNKITSCFWKKIYLFYWLFFFAIKSEHFCIHTQLNLSKLNPELTGILNNPKFK
jgi:hypothetical protein